MLAFISFTIFYEFRKDILIILKIMYLFIYQKDRKSSQII